MKNPGHIEAVFQRCLAVGTSDDRKVLIKLLFKSARACEFDAVMEVGGAKASGPTVMRCSRAQAVATRRNCCKNLNFTAPEANEHSDCNFFVKFSPASESGKSQVVDANFRHSCCDKGNRRRLLPKQFSPELSSKADSSSLDHDAVVVAQMNRIQASFQQRFPVGSAGKRPALKHFLHHKASQFGFQLIQEPCKIARAPTVLRCSRAGYVTNPRRSPRHVQPSVDERPKTDESLNCTFCIRLDPSIHDGKCQIIQADYMHTCGRYFEAPAATTRKDDARPAHAPKAGAQSSRTDSVVHEQNKQSINDCGSENSRHDPIKQVSRQRPRINTQLSCSVNAREMENVFAATIILGAQWPRQELLDKVYDFARRCDFRLCVRKHTSGKFLFCKPDPDDHHDEECSFHIIITWPHGKTGKATIVSANFRHSCRSVCRREEDGDSGTIHSIASSSLFSPEPFSPSNESSTFRAAPRKGATELLKTNNDSTGSTQIDQSSQAIVAVDRLDDGFSTQLPPQRHDSAFGPKAGAQSSRTGSVVHEHNKRPIDHCGSENSLPDPMKPVSRKRQRTNPELYCSVNAREMERVFAMTILVGAQWPRQELLDKVYDFARHCDFRLCTRKHTSGKRFVCKPYPDDRHDDECSFHVTITLPRGRNGTTTIVSANFWHSCHAVRRQEEDGDSGTDQSIASSSLSTPDLFSPSNENSSCRTAPRKGATALLKINNDSTRSTQIDQTSQAIVAVDRLDRTQLQIQRHHNACGLEAGAQSSRAGSKVHEHNKRSVDHCGSENFRPDPMKPVSRKRQRTNPELSCSVNALEIEKVFVMTFILGAQWPRQELLDKVYDFARHCDFRLCMRKHTSGRILSCARALDDHHDEECSFHIIITWPHGGKYAATTIVSANFRHSCRAVRRREEDGEITTDHSIASSSLSTPEPFSPSNENSSFRAAPRKGATALLNINDDFSLTTQIDQNSQAIVAVDRLDDGFSTSLRPKRRDNAFGLNDNVGKGQCQSVIASMPKSQKVPCRDSSGLWLVLVRYAMGAEAASRNTASACCTPTELFIPLAQLPYSIGRDAASAAGVLPADCEQVSRQHFQIERKAHIAVGPSREQWVDVHYEGNATKDAAADAFVLTCLSKNGMSVNGMSLKRNCSCSLRDGDVLQVSTTIFLAVALG